MINDNDRVITERWFPLPEAVKNHEEHKRVSSSIKNMERDWHFTIVAGRRSFKTEKAKRFIVSKAVENAKHRYYATAPTRQQAKEIFWEDLKLLTPAFLIKSISETELKITLTNGTFIKVAGMEAYKRIEGTPANGIILGEYQEVDPDAYLSIQPMIIDTGGWVIKEGRPIGKNHFYDDYMRGVNKEPGYKSFHWMSAGILSAEQIDIAKKDLGIDDFKREYEADFESGHNSPYYSYNYLNNNSEFRITNRLPLIVACDFNATEKPMSWVLGQRLIIGTQDVTYWLKSFAYPFTNTETMCGILWDYLQKIDRPKEIIFYGDYAGKQVKSNSSQTDWQIIEKYFSNKFTFSKKIRPCLSIRDSIGSTNAQLCNTLGERRQFINPEECKPLLTDWLKCEWKENGKELSEKNNLLGHSCRAVDYYNYYEHPIRGKIKTTITHN